MREQEHKLAALLNAYVDDLITEQMREKFSDYLYSDPKAQVQINQFDTLNTRLRLSYSQRLKVPTTNSLQQFVETYSEKEPSKKNGFRETLSSYFDIPHMAIYASIMLLSLFFSYILPKQVTTKKTVEHSFIEQIKALAQDAHMLYSTQTQHIVEVPARNKTHLIMWLTKQLGADIEPANLSSFKYRLIGGRLLPSMTKQAALFMYKDKNERYISLYIRHNKSEKKSNRLQCDLENSNASICSWQGSKMMYFLIGPANNIGHQAISHQAAKQLNK